MKLKRYGVLKKLQKYNISGKLGGITGGQRLDNVGEFPGVCVELIVFSTLVFV